MRNLTIFASLSIILYSCTVEIKENSVPDYSEPALSEPDVSEYPANDINFPAEDVVAEEEEVESVCEENTDNILNVTLDTSPYMTETYIDGEMVGDKVIESYYAYPLQLSQGKHHFLIKQEICYPKEFEICIYEEGQHIRVELEQIPYLTVTIDTVPSGLQVCGSTEPCEHYTPFTRDCWAGTYDFYIFAADGSILYKEVELEGEDGEEIEVILYSEDE